MPKLTLLCGGRVLQEMGVGRTVTIGRLPDYTMVIDSAAVSGHHAHPFSIAIARQGDRDVATGLGGGPLVNIVPLAGPWELTDGDVLRVCGLTLEFRRQAA